MKRLFFSTAFLFISIFLFAQNEQAFLRLLEVQDRDCYFENDVSIVEYTGFNSSPGNIQVEYQFQLLQGGSVVYSSPTNSFGLASTTGVNELEFTYPSVGQVPSGEYDLNLVVTYGHNNINEVDVTTFYPNIEIQCEQVLPSGITETGPCEVLLLENVRVNVEACCTYNPYFFQEVCRVGDELEIAMTSSGAGPFHNWRIWLVDEGETCNPNNTDNAELVFNQTNSNPNGEVTFTFPNLNFDDLVGRCFIIRHGMWNFNCSWRQFHRTVTIPDIPAVDPFFSSNSVPNGPNSRVWFYEATGQNTIPVSHSWTAERSNSINGPWTTWSVTAGQNTPNFTVLQLNNQFFRICQEVSSTLDGVCSRSTHCIIISPLNEGLFLITSEDGRVIGEESTTQNDDETEDGGSGRNSNRSAMGDLSNLEDEILLFPNPARDHFKLSNNTAFDVQVEVYNTNGQLMMSNQINANNLHSFDTNSLASGIYIIQVKDMQTGNFIKTEKLSIVK